MKYIINTYLSPKYKFIGNRINYSNITIYKCKTKKCCRSSYSFFFFENLSCIQEIIAHHNNSFKLFGNIV